MAEESSQRVLAAPSAASSCGGPTAAAGEHQVAEDLARAMLVKEPSIFRARSATQRR
jgi:hypothetical protein